MDVKNQLQPTGDQMRDFRDGATGTDIYMLNLLKFRDQAVYEDGRETELTGQQAYALYASKVSEIIKDLGGSISFSGTVRHLLIGDVETLWDAVAIGHYPSMAIMGKMMQMPEYQAAHVHRHAGLAGQLLIECDNKGGFKL